MAASKVDTSFDHHLVAWRFSTADIGGEFAWPQDAETVKKIHEKLHAYDSMTWSEVLKQNNHLISFEDLHPVAQKRLKEIKKEDTEKVFSFHETGKARIFAIREHNVAKLLWWDPHHQVCPSVKKHS